MLNPFKIYQQSLYIHIQLYHISDYIFLGDVDLCPAWWSSTPGEWQEVGAPQEGLFTWTPPPLLKVNHRGQQKRGSRDNQTVREGHQQLSVVMNGAGEESKRGSLGCGGVKKATGPAGGVMSDFPPVIHNLWAKAAISTISSFTLHSTR